MRVDLPFLLTLLLQIVAVRSSVVCSNATDLERRISQAFDDRGRMTNEGASLQVVVDNVLSADECRVTVQALGNKFMDGAGYRTETGKKYYYRPVAFSGIDIRTLSETATRNQFDTLMEMRKRAHKAAEEAMGLCPGTLVIEYTHFTQKQAGGSHGPHADNCYALYGTGLPVAVCDGVNDHLHPYPHRVVSSITYLNEDFDGGEFYWADQSTGEPKTVVRPKPGRMMVFSSGAESLHGALPVVDRGDAEPSRRLALALWFGTDPDVAEVEPKYVGDTDEAVRKQDEL